MTRVILTAEQIADIESVREYLYSNEFEVHNDDFREIFGPTDPHKQRVKELEDVFSIKFTKIGFEKMLKLLTHYYNNNDRDYVVGAFTEWSSDIPRIFENLVSRFAAASTLRKILEHIVTPAPQRSTSDIEVGCGLYKKGIISYVAGYSLKKASKHPHANSWTDAISAVTQLPGYELLSPENEFFNFMNDEKFGGRLKFFPSQPYKDFLGSVFIKIQRYCTRGLQQWNLLALYNEIISSEVFTQFYHSLESSCESKALLSFLEYVTKLFVRVCFYKLVKNASEKLKKNEAAKAKPLRVSLQNPLGPGPN